MKSTSFLSPTLSSKNSVIKYAGHFFLGLILAMGPIAVFAQQSTDSLATNASHPNHTPYTSERSVGHHILAFPSYLLHWATRPVGWGITYAEENFPNLFEGERGPYGFFPMIEAGGEEGFAAGLMLYHDHLFFKNHKARAEILFGSEDYNEFDLEYHIPINRKKGHRLSLRFDYENDPIRSYYNTNQEYHYKTEEAAFQSVYQHTLSRKVSTKTLLSYRNVTINQGDFDDDDDVFPFPNRLQGNTELLTIGNEWSLDFRTGDKRIFNGSRYLFGVDWSQSLESESFSYLDYHFELQHFIPVGLLPKSRRFGIKARLDKTEQLSGDQVPFFDQPSLGSSQDLRGYSSNRFHNNGSLLFTLEYRYPMWSFADVTLFIDEGQVFNRYNDIALDDFHTSYGFGFHVLSAKGLAFRAEFAFSKETSRFIIGITPNF